MTLICELCALKLLSFVLENWISKEHSLEKLDPSTLGLLVIPYCNESLEARDKSFTVSMLKFYALDWTP